MKRGFFVLFAFFIWFVGTNHCALEQITGLPQSACPCETSSSDTDHSHGHPCLSLKSIPTQNVSVNVDNIDHVDLNLQITSLLSLVFNSEERDPKNSKFAQNLNTFPIKQIHLATQAPNAPPLI